MVSIALKRTNNTNRWNIPDKFINYDFAGFLDNTFPESEGHKIRDERYIEGYGSIVDYAYYYQLEQSHGITLNAILKLLDDKGCLSELNRKDNYLKYNFPNVNRLRIEILARIKKHPGI